MLDQDIAEQLKEHFSKLEGTITLLYEESSHPDQKALLELLTAVAQTSNQIRLLSGGGGSAFPSFQILHNEKKTGISFKAIPTGHEFTTLILAILNADGKGRFPDEAITHRIKNLKGPLRLRTFISLECENCPHVVQSLNLMTLLHEDFEHEILDGGYFQEEISRLGIQGVPSLMKGERLFHSGRIELLDLLTKLEKEYGKKEEFTEPKDLGLYDVVIVGGGPAGSSAAIYAARKGLKTAIIAERIGGQVRETKGIENLISVLYTEGPVLAAKLNEHMANYPIQILEHRRVEKIKQDKIKTLELQSGEFLQAKAVILTTGAKWRELGVPGEKEYIGRGVAFCPHCDGPYYAGKKVAVVGGGNSGVEAAIDLSHIVKELVLVEFAPELRADKVLVDKLKSLPNVSIVTNAKTTEIEGDGQKVLALHYEDRASLEKKTISLDGVFVQIGLVPNSGFVRELVEVTKSGEIVVDEKGKTSAAGIYAAGDVTTVPYKQIIISMGEGAKAALAAFEDLSFGHI